MVISLWKQRLNPHLRFTLQVKHTMTDLILKQLTYDLRVQGRVASKPVIEPIKLQWPEA